MSSTPTPPGEPRERHAADPLDALSTDALRDLLRELLPTLVDRPRTRLLDTIAERAARDGWRPPPPGDLVARVTAFTETVRHGSADPSTVDGFLRQAHLAFLGRNYAATFAIYRMLLPPLESLDIDVGHRESLDEVLHVDIARCAAQYVIAMYMTSAPRCRAEAVWRAISEVYPLGYFWLPLRELERVAVEPLPDWDRFLSDWRAWLGREEEESQEERVRSRRGDWLREVTERLDGTEGLAALARATRRADHYRAWCNVLEERRDWAGALEAHVEAATAATPDTWQPAYFRDGACLAAQELGRDDLATYLEDAWRAAPSFLRLRRWLGNATHDEELHARATVALEACPADAAGQRALLRLVLGDVESTAAVLTNASGLGWWDASSEGHVVFEGFRGVLDGTDKAAVVSGEALGERADLDVDELEESSAIRPDEPSLRAPSATAIIAHAWMKREVTAAVRRTMLAAMRSAAEARVKSVVEQKDRREYASAASLVLACVALDGSETTLAWRDDVRREVRRYPAMCRYLEGASGSTSSRG